MIDSICVLQSSAYVTSITVKIYKSWHNRALRFWMSNEVGVQRDLITGLNVDDLEWQRKDFGRCDARSMLTNVGIEEEIVLD